MNATGNLIVFGSLFLVIALGIGSWIVAGATGKIMIGLAIFGSIIWIVCAFQILSALNSDI